MLSGDRSTALLRGSLDQAGFNTHGWGSEFNTVVSRETVARVAQRLVDISDKTGQPVVVIGWSLGGLYARLLAHRMPEHVALVATLGSPFSGDRHANNAWRLYEWLNDHKVDSPPFAEDISKKPPVPTLAFWSPKDGVVAPECARGEEDQCDMQIELLYRHFELGSSRRAINEVLNCLRRALA
ncbi:alpha/beta hydrolase [Qipengyuania sp. DSG2-2]|uniref:alpha/beta hydrolase n=1 Tax=Qipengyuania sp. DGS2-2 TaxID=3349631 RepID=UPI0036D34101